MVDAANPFGQQQVTQQQVTQQQVTQQRVTLRSLADAFPRARWVRAFNSLSASIMANDHHRQPPWVMFLSGDEEAKPVVAQLIREAGFDPLSRLCDKGSYADLGIIPTTDHLPW